MDGLVSKGYPVAYIDQATTLKLVTDLFHSTDVSLKTGPGCTHTKNPAINAVVPTMTLERHTGHISFPYQTEAQDLYL